MNKFKRGMAKLEKVQKMAARVISTNWLRRDMKENYRIITAC